MLIQTIVNIITTNVLYIMRYFAFLQSLILIQYPGPDCRHGGGRGHGAPAPPLPPPPPPPFSEANFIFLRKIKLREREGAEEKSDKKMTQERGRAVKKVCPLQKILLCTCFYNSIFSSWILMNLYISEQHEKDIQPYQCIWDIYIKFGRSY